MRNRRRRWILRRMVLGFAIVAVAAPVAQARVDEGTVSKPGFVQGVTDFPSSVSHGVGASHTGFADRVVDVNPAVNVEYRGNADRVGSSRALQYGPTVGSEYNQFAYRRSLPSDVAQYSQFAYRRALPQDVGSQPIQVASKADGIDWGDAGIGAGLAFALMLLAAGATVGSRHLGRTASA